MTNSRIRVHLSREVSRAARRFRTGVSLHGHTQHSKENLGFISRRSGDSAASIESLPRKVPSSTRVTG